MLNSKNILLGAALAFAIAGPVVADAGIYGGLGVSRSFGSSTHAAFGGTSRDAFNGATLVVGVRKDLNKMFWAAEIEGGGTPNSSFVSTFGTSCTVFAAGPYYCSIDSTLRLKAIAGIPLKSGYEVFGSAGVIQISGQSAVGPGTQASNPATGYSFGVGIQRDADFGKIRLEVIQDLVPTSTISIFGSSANYRATSVNLTILFNLK